MKLLAISLAMSVSVFAQTNQEPTELTKLRNSWSASKVAAIKPLDAKYAAALSAMKDQFIKAGNLESAVSVDTELKALLAATAEKGKGTLTPTQGEKSKDMTTDNSFEGFEGTWTVIFKSGFIHKYIINKDGSLKNVEGGSENRKLYRIKNDVMMDFAADKIQRLSLVQKRLYVEHWYPAKDYFEKKPPANFGTSSEEKQ